MQARVSWFRVRALPRDRAGQLALLRAAALPSILLVAFVVRVYHFSGEAFPLNDGGLFYLMAQEIQQASFRLPEFTSYNDAGIPFAYPPLAFYAAALFDSLTPASLMDAFVFLPLAGTVFAVWAFWRLARVVLRNEWAVAVATLAFALVPRSFAWPLMGGGLPRSFALAFAILAIAEAYRLAERRSDEDFSRRRSVILLGVFAGVTALTHLETAAFLALTCIVLLVFHPRRFVEYAIAGGIATVMALPWGALVIARHGLEPFTASIDHGGRLLNERDLSVDWVIDVLRNPVSTGEPFFPIVGALGVVGAILAIGRGQWFLPVWWLAIFVAAMRAFPTFGAIPTALLAGLAVSASVVPVLRQAWDGGGFRARVGVGVAAIAVFALTLSGAVERNIGQAEFLRSVPGEDQAAMAWIDENIAEDAHFAVVPVRPWYADHVSEWFPVLAQRTSVATAQGYEWLEGEFNEQLEIHGSLLRCANAGYSCLRAALEDIPYTHIYVPAECCEPLKASLTSSGRYRVLYDVGTLIAVPASRPGLADD